MATRRSKYILVLEEKLTKVEIEFNDLETEDM